MILELDPARMLFANRSTGNRDRNYWRKANNTGGQMKHLETKPSGRKRLFRKRRG